MRDISGLGNHKIATIGNCKLKLVLSDALATTANFRVVDDQVMKFPMILGRRFLKEHKMVLKPASRIVQIPRQDGSIITLQFEEHDSKVKEMLVENLKVYAAQNTYLTKDTQLVNFEMEIPNTVI